jgi:hypothetical protein
MRAVVGRSHHRGTQDAACRRQEAGGRRQRAADRAGQDRPGQGRARTGDAARACGMRHASGWRRGMAVVLEKTSKKLKWRAGRGGARAGAFEPKAGARLRRHPPNLANDPQQAGGSGASSSLHIKRNCPVSLLHVAGSYDTATAIHCHCHTIYTYALVVVCCCFASSRISCLTRLIVPAPP